MSNRNTADHSTGTPKAGALEDLRVVDMSRYIAGPYCAMLLGDMGTDVVKVEPRERGESSRAFGPFVEGESLYTMVFNRNKRSLTLDLRSDQGKELLHDLLRKADVLVENFVPGTLEKIGFDRDTLWHFESLSLRGEAFAFFLSTTNVEMSQETEQGSVSNLRMIRIGSVNI